MTTSVPAETSSKSEPHANHSAVGATVTRVYYAVPSHYTIGECFDNYLKAVEFAREKLSDTNKTVYVDTRMVLTFPNGRGSDDFVFKRDTFTE